MKILVDNYQHNIKAFKGEDLLEITSFDDLKQFKKEDIDIYILDPNISHKRISLPPAKDKDLKKSIPYLLKDETLSFSEESHYIFTKPDENNDSTVSFVNSKWMANIFQIFNQNDLNVRNLFPLELCGFKDTLLIFNQGNLTTINFCNKWGWTAETELINNLLNQGLKEYKCSQVISFSNQVESDFSFLKDSYTFRHNKIENELEFLNQLNLTSESKNLLQGIYSPKILWNKKIIPCKASLVSLCLVIILLFSSKAIEISYNHKNSNQILHSADELFFQKFPDSSRSELKEFIKKEISQPNKKSTKKFIEVLFNISTSINSNDKVSLSSLTYDSDKNEYLIEIECLQFEDLEVIKSVITNQGYLVKEGSSKRVGSSIYSEIFIKI